MTNLSVADMLRAGQFAEAVEPFRVVVVPVGGKR